MNAGSRLELLKRSAQTFTKSRLVPKIREFPTGYRRHILRHCYNRAHSAEPAKVPPEIHPLVFFLLSMRETIPVTKLSSISDTITALRG